MHFTLRFLFTVSGWFRWATACIPLLLTTGLLVCAGNPVAGQAPAALAISVSSATLCAGASTSLIVSGCAVPGVIRWSTAQTGSSIVAAPLQTTVYSVTCTRTTVPVASTAVSTTAVSTTVTSTTATATVRVSPPIAVITQLIPVSCSGRSDGQIVVGATGGTAPLQYQFSGQPFQPGNTLTGLKAGNYAVGVKDAAGCQVPLRVSVTEPLPLSLSITAVGAKCVGGADGGLVATASGGVGDYRYVLNDGPPQAGNTFFDLKANTAYTVMVIDKQGCVLRQPVQIGAPAPFDIKLAVRPARCAGSADGSVTVTVEGGKGPYQYQIGTGALQTGALFTGLPANTYELTVQDANGCQGKAQTVVAQPTPLRLTAVAAPVNCFGPGSGSITLTPTGGTGAITYRLTLANEPQASNVFTGVGVGEYSVVGTDANGCTSVSSVTVVRSEPLAVKATVTPASCCVCMTGSIQLVSTGGTGTKRQFQVIGQPYQPASQIGGLRPNTYRLRVIDEVGCTDSVAAVVTDASAMTLSPGPVKNVSCASGADGEASVQVTGGTKPFTYYWMTERRDTLRTRTATQTGLPEGTYTVSVVDTNRCTTATTFVTVRAQNPRPFKPTISQAGSTLQAENQTTGLQWYVRTTGSDPGQAVANGTQPTLVPFASGQYYVVLTVNGCASLPSESINFVLTALNEPLADLWVRVYPNPVRHWLRVEIEQARRGAVQLQLHDASGRLVGQYQLPAFSGKKWVEYPLSGLPAGTYLLNAGGRGAKQATVRVVVE